MATNVVYGIRTATNVVEGCEAATESGAIELAKLAKLVNAAVTVAYQEVYQSFGIEKMISDFVENDTVKKLLESDTE